MHTLLLLLFFVFSASYLQAKDIIELQMLMSKEKQKEASFDRQRAMYPQSAKIRLSAEACHKGFYYLEKEISPLQREYYLNLAIKEFNRAWRFNPNQYAAWVGAGILRGEQAQITDDIKLRGKYLKDSILLLNKALELAPKNRKDKVTCELVASYNLYGYYLISENKVQEGERFLNKGKEYINKILKNSPKNGHYYHILAVNSFFRKDKETAKKAIKKAKQYKYPISKDLENKIEKLK